MTDKTKALRDFLKLDKSQSIEVDGDYYRPEGTGEEYLVLTDEEADIRTEDYIKDSVWAFNPDFLLSYMPDGMTIEAIKAIQEKYEDASEPLLKLIGDRLEDFISDAISSDGRGHFISGYDGEENEAGDFYIYRTN